MAEFSCLLTDKLVFSLSKILTFESLDSATRDRSNLPPMSVARHPAHVVVRRDPPII